MRNLRLLLFLIAFSAALLAQVPFDGKSGPLVKEAYQLLDHSKVNEALAKFQEAAKVDPKSSYPVSGLSKLFLLASRVTDPAHVEDYRSNAEHYARQALELNDMDFYANQVIAELEGWSTESSHTPKREAIPAFNEAEASFNAKEYEKAKAGYRKALDLDPAFTDAVLYLADCHLLREEFPEAEALFRKVTQMEPGYARAWRFLADCLARSGKVDQAQDACLGAIAAQPNDYNAWARLRQMREISGKPLKRFKPKPKAGVKPGEKGQINILVEEGNTGPEGAAWMAYAMSKAADLTMEDTKTQQDGKATKSKDFEEKKKTEILVEILKSKSAFTRELEAWKAALAVFSETSEGKQLIPKDPTLMQMHAFAHDGQLEASILFLMYREAYRPDFEAFKKKNPRAIYEFVARYGLCP
jgi:tetratricopeptide (TPR) repeat protein